jgi:hypothetical protein
VGAACNPFGALPVLKMIYEAVIRVREKWRGVKVSDLENRQLKRLREQLARDLMTTDRHVSYLERVVFSPAK